MCVGILRHFKEFVERHKARAANINTSNKNRLRRHFVCKSRGLSIAEITMGNVFCSNVSTTFGKAAIYDCFVVVYNVDIAKEVIAKYTTKSPHLALSLIRNCNHLMDASVDSTIVHNNK